MAVTVQWLGHATFMLTLDGHKVLIDPFLDENPTATVKAADVKPDFIAITHGHGDHISDAVPIAKRTGAPCVSNNEIALWLRGQGVQAHGQHLGGGYRHPFGYLKLTIAHHGSMLPDGSNGGNPAGLIFTSQSGKKLYFAGDTALFMDMQLYGEEGLDLAVLPIGDNFTMGPDDALRALKFLKPKAVIPCHFNTWPPIRVDEKAWIARVNAETSTKGVLLEVNGNYTVE